MNIVLAFPLLVYAVFGDVTASKVGEAVKVAEIPNFCEGIVFDTSGDFYVSDMRSGTIYRVTRQGRVHPWSKTKKPNGHKILPDGTHLVCDGGEKAVLRLDAGGKVIGRASSGWRGKPLAGPNDLTLDSHGGFYFTDPEGSWTGNPIGAVYYVDRKGETHQVAAGLAYPNGIAVRPDGKVLYVGEGARNRILSFDIRRPGKVDSQRVLIELPEKQGEQIDNHADGMTLDDSGNLYVAHYGMGRIRVVSPDGRLLKSYRAGNLSCSNVAFAVQDMSQLYISGALHDGDSPGAVFRLDLSGVRGLKVQPEK